jgi:hypothetical protein
MRLEARLREFALGVVAVIAIPAPLSLAAQAPSQSPSTGTPTAPVTISRKISKPNYPCYREYLYRGESIGCDSTLGPDGEGLRPVVKQVPESVALLDQYQKDRRNLKNLAYVGSAGLVTLLLTQYAVSRITDASARTLVQTLGTATGAGLLAGGLVWGLVVVYRSDGRLEEITRIYNAKRPDDPIQLQFSTEVKF